MDTREHQLRSRIQALIEESGLPVCITEDDRIVHANRAAVQAMQADSPEQLRGRLAWQVLYPGQVERARARLARCGVEQAASSAPASATSPTTCATAAAATGASESDDATPPQPFIMRAVASEFSQRRRLVDELDRSRRVLREMSLRVEQAREEERRLIARQLHDELGQQLSMIKLGLDPITGDDQPELTRELARGVSQLIDSSVATLRRIAAELRPLTLDDLGLNAAVEWLAHQVAREHGMGVTVRLGDSEPPVSDEAAILLFRLAQEALANAVRHSAATLVELSLTCREGEVCLSVQDNGIGMPDDALERPGTLGLKGMRERVAMLGGKFQVGNPPGWGARVHVQMPLAGAAPAAGACTRPATPRGEMPPAAR